MVWFPQKLLFCSINCHIRRWNKARRVKTLESPGCLGGWSPLLKINDALRLIMIEMETEIGAAALWIKSLETSSFTSPGFITPAFIGHGSEVAPLTLATLSTRFITQRNDLWFSVCLWNEIEFGLIILRGNGP